MFKQSKTINTSLKQIPAQVKKIKWNDYIGLRILDYGAGKYPELVQNYILEEYGIEIESYDPYNPVISVIPEGQFDMILCSNVLNVLSSDDILRQTIQDISNKTLSTGEVHIQIYFGDSSGISKETTKGWQRNIKTEYYVDILYEHFEEVEAFYNKIICTYPK